MAKRIKIEIANLQMAQKINRPLLRKILSHTMREAGVGGTLSVAVVDSQEITELNRRFLGRAEPTDVLSFPMEDGASDDFGEVVVCAEIAGQEAVEWEISFDAELALYAVHGLLHLLGYDDLTSKQRSRMREREREILRGFGLEVP
jgi:probable rRNA maturation factor